MHCLFGERWLYQTLLGFTEKKGILLYLYQSQSVVHLSVHVCMHAFIRTYVHTAVMFLVNASPPNRWTCQLQTLQCIDHLI